MVKEKNKKKKKQKSENIDLKEAINFGYQDGINALLENNPNFKQYGEYIQKHIDKSALDKVINYSIKEVDNIPNLNEKQKNEYIHYFIANYIASGEILDDKAKKVVLKKGALEEKAKSWNPFSKFFGERKLNGEKYLENTLEAFQDLYAMFKTGDYAQRMPELAKAVQTINDMGFLSPAIDILKSYELIDEKKYSLLKKSIKETTKKSSELAVKGIESYVTQKAAAILVGSIGALMVLTSANMTGGVIGALGSNSIKIIGAILFFIALILFLIINKKKSKAVHRRKKKSKTFKNR